MATDGHKVSLADNGNIPKLDCGDSCTTLNIVKTIELHTLKESVIWYASYILIKL